METILQSSRNLNEGETHVCSLTGHDAVHADLAIVKLFVTSRWQMFSFKSLL